MAINLNTNLNALQNQRNLSEVENSKRQTIAKLSSGKAVNNAADNAAALAVAEGLQSQINGYNQAVRNTFDGVSVVQTADDALGRITDNSQRIAELAIQAGNGTLNANDKAAIQKEVDQLTQANSQIVQNTSFNGQSLLTGGSLTFQSGPDGSSQSQISVQNANLSAAPGAGGLNGYNANLQAAGTIDITNPNALSQVQSDLQQLSQYRADLGAASNRFGTAIENLTNSSINSEESRSRIRDADVAALSSQLAQQQILSNSSLAVQAQSNLSPQLALGLLRN